MHNYEFVMTDASVRGMRDLRNKLACGFSRILVLVARMRNLTLALFFQAV